MTLPAPSQATRPGDTDDELSAQAVQEVGVDITGRVPKSIAASMVRDADLVVIIGRDAKVAQIPGTRFEVCDTDEPSDRGIDGIERMRPLRDDIAATVTRVAQQLPST